MKPNRPPDLPAKQTSTLTFRRLRLLVVLGVCSAQSSTAQTVLPTSTDKPAGRACPGKLDTVANCYGGRDENGAYYLIAVPKVSNGILVIHAHGGPRHVPPAPNGSDEDLVRFSVMVRAGYSWIGTTYRNGGYGIRLAAQDVDHSRSIFWQQFGRPKKTVLHGQSYGGNVVAKLAELDALDAEGTAKYDGVILTSAAVGKRIETYNILINTRVVYQYFCRNLPLPEEAQYPAWQGLPKQSAMSPEELHRRVNHCTGADLAPTARTPKQARNLRAILGATGEKEKQLATRLELTAFRFQDVVHNFLGGLNPFDNTSTVYKGSGSDAELNKGVERFAGTASARDRLAYDSDLSGGIVVPTIALQAKFDPVVNYQAQSHYQRIVERAGQSHLLVQLLTSEDQHSKLSESEYLAVLSAMTNWIDSGKRPTANAIKQRCAAFAAQYGQPCLFIDDKGN